MPSSGFQIKCCFQLDLELLLDTIMGWRLTGDLLKAAEEFKISTVDDLEPVRYRLEHRLTWKGLLERARAHELKSQLV